MIYSDQGNSMAELLEKVLAKDVVMSICTEELFNTYNDDNISINIE